MRNLPPEVEIDTLTQFINAKTARDRAQARVDELQERLIKEMEANQTKTLDYQSGSVVGKVTYVRGTTTKIDEKGLRKALTAKVYDKYTVKKLDKRAMELAMDEGAVDPMVVLKYVTTDYNKPYLRVSAAEASE